MNTDSNKSTQFEGQHQCDQCDYKTPNFGKLKRHSDEVHLKKKRYNCTKCSAGFNDKKSLKRHGINTHGEVDDLERFAQCMICQKKFLYESGLKRHMSSHKSKEELRFQCENCDYKADHWDMMDKHERTVHLKEKQFACKLCSYKASEKQSLQRHLKTHSNENGTWKCEYCPLNYSTKQALTIHKKNEHHKEMEKYFFQCKLCPLKYCRKAKLTLHMKQKH